jgi:hypothetical protein
MVRVLIFIVIIVVGMNMWVHFVIGKKKAQKA